MPMDGRPLNSQSNAPCSLLRCILGILVVSFAAGLVPAAQYLCVADDRLSQSEPPPKGAGPLPAQGTSSAGPIARSDAGPLDTHEHTSSGTESTPRFLLFFGGVLLGSVAACVRLAEKFRHYKGLGVFRSVYAWSFVGFVALLSGVSYIGFSEISALLGHALGKFSPAFMQAAIVGGAGGGGHALVALGRLIPRRKPSPSPPNQVGESLTAESSNAILMFFYNGIYDHVTETMHLCAERLASAYDWKTVRSITCRLLEDEVTVGRLSPEEGSKVADRIRGLPLLSDEEAQLDHKYLALSWTIGKCSYFQLESRLMRVKVQ